ncbi:MAG TPA: SoxR reducing system RseC family protein [Methylococcaceae bacterium]|nr:SoxR reducing system RseC family protein [Methylococcaceae bacterium]
MTAIRGEWMTVEKLGGGAACTRCTQSCPSAYPHRIRRNSSTQWQTPIQPTARPGDVWRVGVDPAALLRGAGCVYVLPLAGLLTGAILGDGVAGDAGAALGGLTGLALFLFRLWISRPVSREISLVFIKKIHSA